MSLTRFLNELFEHGRVRVTQLAPTIADEDYRAAGAVLQQAERVRKLEFPGQPPPWDAHAARWSAGLFYRACQLTAERDAGEEELIAALGVPCPIPRSPSVDYSVDLVFCFLPDLFKLARSHAPHDPLLDALMAWAVDWPLSSVGIPLTAAPRLDAILEDRYLLRFFAQRVIARRAVNLAEHPAVQAEIRHALGLHVELAPEFKLAVPSEGDLRLDSASDSV